MTRPAHFNVSDLRGLGLLAADATVGLADLVEAMHHTIGRRPLPFGRAPEGRTTGITGLVYGSVRGITRVAGGGVDALLGLLAPLVAQRRSSDEREAVLAALNGVLGDYLEASRNPLAIPMRLRRGGVPLTLTVPELAAAIPEAGNKVLVLLHGLCMNDRQWLRDGHDHGAALARDAGYTPVYLHYNSGRRVCDSGRELAGMLEALLVAWPVPIAEIAMLGHSMGGLVARSAVHGATLAGYEWPGRVARLVTLGTPHLGAPLERAGAMADYLIGISPYSVPFVRLGKLRSAGIQDLRYGSVIEADGRTPAAGGARQPLHPLSLPSGVRCYAIAASRQSPPKTPGARVRGDGLVPVASALGRHHDSSFALAFPEMHRFVAYESGHLDLLARRDVYECVLRWLSEAAVSR
ncbi:MAG: alpha/beta hydrolase [Burkholderiales bacterium]|nr:alpha/beta hydrolase [Burkholderiales bacterium]